MRNSKRMEGLAQLCQGARRVIDVGCDHAQLCVLLVQHYGVEYAFASDIRPGPLENARRTIQAYGLSDCIEPRLCSGLSGFGPADADTIVIAGMGGDEIAAILKDAPWTKDGAHKLVLQPMTAAPRLRRWLVEHGYAIAHEVVLTDAGRVYAAMNITNGIDKSGAGEFEYLFTSHLLRHELWPLYRDKLLQKYRVIAQGQRHANQFDTPEQRALRLLESFAAKENEVK